MTSPVNCFPLHLYPAFFLQAFPQVDLHVRGLEPFVEDGFSNFRLGKPVGGVQQIVGTVDLCCLTVKLAGVATDDAEIGIVRRR